MSDSRLSSATLGAVLDQVATHRPDALAVVDEVGSATYSELQSLAHTVARSLIALGVERGDHVACLMRNRMEWIACCVATAKLGAVFVPINTWYRQHELQWTLTQVGAVVLLAEREFSGHDYAADLEHIEPAVRSAEPGQIAGRVLPKLRSVAYLGRPSAGSFSWDEFLALGRHVDPAELSSRQNEVSPDDALLVVYTSGSSAEPKGVVLPHGRTMANGYGSGDRRGIEENDRIWLGLPLCYAGGAANAVPAAFTHGAALVLQGRFQEERAIDVIEKEECTVFYGTSNMVRRIYEAPTYARHRLASLSKGVTGSQREEQRLLLVDMGVTGATQSYGSTETCGSCFVGYPDDSLETKLDTCGRLVPGFEAHIVDPGDGRPLGVGEIGLLKVRGHTAKGYLNDPEGTALAFDEDGFYSTGDLGSIGSDGYFRFHSRLKEMVKTGGINVSPLEVESLIRSHPSVSEAYVVGIPDRVKGEVVGAFVVAREKLTEREIQEHVASIAASFKVPARVIFRTSEELPRSTASGKILKAQLRSLFVVDRPGRGGPETAPVHRTRPRPVGRA